VKFLQRSSASWRLRARVVDQCWSDPTPRSTTPENSRST
jgi:hypothetical protein